MTIQLRDDTATEHERIWVRLMFKSVWAIHYGIRVKVIYEDYEDEAHSSQGRLYLCHGALHLVTYYRERYWANFDGSVQRGFPPVRWEFFKPGEKCVLCRLLLKIKRVFTRK